MSQAIFCQWKVKLIKEKLVLAENRMISISSKFQVGYFGLSDEKRIAKWIKVRLEVKHLRFVPQKSLFRGVWHFWNKGLR